MTLYLVAMVKLRVHSCGEGYILAEPARIFWGLRKELYVKIKCQKSYYHSILRWVSNYQGNKITPSWWGMIFKKNRLRRIRAARLRRMTSFTILLICLLVSFLRGSARNFWCLTLPLTRGFPPPPPPGLTRFPQRSSASFLRAKFRQRSSASFLTTINGL